jgi:hypothetical protein
MICANKIIFVHLPKTGGTLLREYFEYISNLSKVEINIGKSSTFSGVAAHATVGDFKNKETAYKFGLVRNPFDWYVSRYFYFQKKGCAEGAVSVKNDCGLYGDSFRQKFPTLKHHLLHGVENDSIPRFWLSSLYQYMFYDNGLFSMNHVGKLENIDQEIDNLWSTTGVEKYISLKEFDNLSNRFHRNASKHNHYQEYYDNEMIDIVLKYDELVLDKYNYEF